MKDENVMATSQLKSSQVIHLLAQRLKVEPSALMVKTADLHMKGKLIHESDDLTFTLSLLPFLQTDVKIFGWSQWLKK